MSLMMFRRVLLALALAACFAAPASAQVSQSAPFVPVPGTYKSVDATNYWGRGYVRQDRSSSDGAQHAGAGRRTIPTCAVSPAPSTAQPSPFAGWPSTNSWPVKLIMGAVDQTDVPVVIPTRTTVTSDFPFNEVAYSGRGLRSRFPDLDLLSEWRDFDAFSECRGGRGQRHRYLWGDRLRFG